MFNPGPCVAAAFCWIQVALEKAVLEAANIILASLKTVADGAIAIAAGVVGVAEAVLTTASAFLTVMQYLFFSYSP